MQDQELLDTYKKQLENQVSDDANQVDLEPIKLNPSASAWGNPDQINAEPADQPSLQSPPKPAAVSNQPSNKLAKIKTIIAAKQNRKFIYIGGFVFFLVSLALLAPIIVSILPRPKPTPEPEPTFIPIDRDRAPTTFEFDSQINQDFTELEQAVSQIEIVDLRLSFPQTEWKVDY